MAHSAPPQHQHQPTVEDLYSRDFPLDTASLSLRVDILDTAGGHQFPAMRNLAIQQGQAARQEGRQAGRKVGRQAGMQAGRQAGRQLGRQAGRQKCRQEDR